MDKVRLCFYSGLGGSLVVGDSYTLAGIKFTAKSEQEVESINNGSSGYFININSFTERENKGVQPVPDGFPVVLTLKDGRIPGYKSSLAKDVDWGNSYWYTRWKPDYDKLLEMQKEHDLNKEFCKAADMSFNQEKPIEELMINAKGSKMSKNNKHPHHDLIVEWAKDTSREIIRIGDCESNWTAGMDVVIKDTEGCKSFQFKPREFQKGHWYPCVDSCGDIEVNMWNGEGFVSITNAIICSQPSEFMQIGKSLGEITFGGEE